MKRNKQKTNDLNNNNNNIECLLPLFIYYLSFKPWNFIALFSTFQAATGLSQYPINLHNLETCLATLHRDHVLS